MVKQITAVNYKIYLCDILVYFYRRNVLVIFAYLILSRVIFEMQAIHETVKGK